MMGKYSMDSFMQMAMGINMNEELKDFRNFEDHPAVKVSEKFEIFSQFQIFFRIYLICSTHLQ